MLNQAFAGCKGVVHVASSGEALPDIETSRAYIEVETALKRRVDDLQERITKFTAKSFVVLFPTGLWPRNTGGSLRMMTVAVKTLREFLLDSRV